MPPRRGAAAVFASSGGGEAASAFLPFTRRDTEPSPAAGGDAPGDSRSGLASYVPGSIMSNPLFSGWFQEQEEDPCFPSMTYKQRLIGFFACLIAAVTCFTLAIIISPFLVLKARKFALLFSFGSLSVLFALSMLRGPANYFKHMIARERIVGNVLYVGSLVATLYAALVERNTLATILCAAVQIVVLAWYTVGYIPGGATGLRYLFKAWLAIVRNLAVPFVTRCLPRCGAWLAS